MNTLKKTLIYLLTAIMIIVCAAAVPKTVFAANETYDISEIASAVGTRKEYELKIGEKEVGDRQLDYGDTVKFAYKERKDANEYGHYSRTAFGIGSYGFYFYHSSGNIDVRTCDLESAEKDWKRSAKGFASISGNAFKEYTEFAVKAELKNGDESTVVLSLAYNGETITKEFLKNENSDMKFRFGDHDIDGNFVKSLAPKTDSEPPVITVSVSEFKVPAGAYPAENAFSVTDNSGECEVALSWSLGALDEFGRLTVGTHVCTITAIDYEKNTSSATITYIVTEDEPIRKYKLTFVADDKTVEEIMYTEETAEYIALPEVPDKEYYEGEWQAFVPEMKDSQTVEAIYTPKKYLVVFKADGETISEQYYTIEDKNITVPEVPKKEGYNGKWADYELKYENITVNAEYTKSEPANPDNPSGNAQSGCGGRLSGESILPAIAACAAALLVIASKKRRERKNG